MRRAGIMLMFCFGIPLAILVIYASFYFKDFLDTIWPESNWLKFIHGSLFIAIVCGFLAGYFLVQREENDPW